MENSKKLELWGKLNMARELIEQVQLEFFKNNEELFSAADKPSADDVDN